LTLVSEGKPAAALAAADEGRLFFKLEVHGSSPLRLIFGARHITRKEQNQSEYSAESAA
jgi:hypothetical protein